MIHPTAIIHPKAQLDSSVSVGPYAVIDEGVQMGARCSVGPHVYLTGVTEIGTGNRFFFGSVVGEAPQDLKYSGEPTRLVIGENNVFREHTTVHRSSKPDQATRIGSNNFIMQHSHIAHDVQMGDHVILAGGALLAGFAIIHDRAFISGNCLVHQFTRVGTLALMQGGSAISKDLPPYTIIRDYNRICGLNVIGLRRAGIAASDRLELKKAYHVLFRSGLSQKAAIDQARKSFSSMVSKTLIDFVATSRRGTCSEVRRKDAEESASEAMDLE